MRLIKMCDRCNKEFELFPDKNGLLTNETCPYCGYIHVVWIKIIVQEKE